MAQRVVRNNIALNTIMYVFHFFFSFGGKRTHDLRKHTHTQTADWQCKITTSIYEFTTRELTSFERLTVTGAGPFYIYT